MPTQAQDRLARAQPPYPSTISTRQHPPISPNSSSSTRKAKAREIAASTTSGSKIVKDKNEMWEERQRRQRAAAVLKSWEMLGWYGVMEVEVGLFFCFFLGFGWGRRGRGERKGVFGAATPGFEEKSCGSRTAYTKMVERLTFSISRARVFPRHDCDTKKL